MSVEANRRDWEDFIILCERDYCFRCKAKEVPLHHHHKEPLEEGARRFTKNQPVTVDRLYELVVKCEPLCVKCHGDLHNNMSSCDDEKVSSTRYQKQVDFTPELDGELGWPETTPKKAFYWSIIK